ncbi:tripartite tricarboxylate transporter substrate binding protein [Pigmentiphaga sp.]|uniref:Bug family tripartite tricarboxylate transporter substrate binding protein n=1 Tax=Pigmentiphaga sp. TaxID=1977564 RepID=UPI00128C6DA2|nr:tripartite tricarboxylate transporter substrate binding protein [Pigmentiphaga sp.]MPS29445.1 tripartite tricarboxylate transporter substrate binding protein [Alcaligenaceae bacterium SAGV5]MPS55411.1 tripartite tricarboxylate transporter substrate binding protein [Alcaligenaceae bacterium SAGV3]MPT60102.1 tripartite tricarboxylate transporter substrate binding protein [Alcaligenaceae bacterium]
MFKKSIAVCLAAAVSGGLTPASAQEGGRAPVRIVVASAPGGNIDVLGRILAEHLSALTHQNYYVENRAGAGGNIGTAYVAQARPDGQTLLIVSTSHTSNVHLYRKVGYDPIKSFTPISSLAQSAFAIAVPTGSKYQTLQDFVADARAHPGRINYGSAGVGQGNHLGMELLKSDIGIDLMHVPFTSMGAVVTALMGAQVDVAMLTLPGALAASDAGKVRILGVTGRQRVAKLAMVPTIREAIGHEFDLTSWQGLLGPAGLPDKQVADLNENVRKVMSSPQVVEQLDRVALTPDVSTPAEFGRFLSSETARWGKVIGDAKIGVDK